MQHKESKGERQEAEVLPELLPSDGMNQISDSLPDPRAQQLISNGAWHGWEVLPLCHIEELRGHGASGHDSARM